MYFQLFLLLSINYNFNFISQWNILDYLKFQRIWNIIKFYTIYFRKKNFFRKISSALIPKNVRFFIVSIVRKPRVSTENNSHMFSLRNMFSRRTKRRILVSLACLVRRYSCYATERLVMSFRLAFPQLCLSLEERKKKEKKKKRTPCMERNVNLAFYPCFTR